MECNEIRELLSAYVDGELSETQRELVEVHVAHCSLCEAALQSHAETREQIGSLKETPPMRSLKEAIMANVSGRSEGSPNPPKPVRWRQILWRPVWKPITMVSLVVIIIASLVAIPPLLGDQATARAESIALSAPEVIKAFGDEPVDSARVTEQTGDTATVEVTGWMGTIVTVKIDLNSGTVMDFQVPVPQLLDDAELEEVLLIVQSDPRIKTLFDEGATVLRMHKSGQHLTEGLNGQPAEIVETVCVVFALGDYMYEAEVELPEGKILSFEDRGEQPDIIAYWRDRINEIKTQDSGAAKLVTIPDVVRHEGFSENTSTQPETILLVAGIISPEEREGGQGCKREVFKLDEGEAFKALFVVGRATPQTYLVSVFVDYEQVVFEMDGMYGLLHEINVPASTKMFIPLNLGVLSPGVHDVQVLMFEDPYNASLDPDFRKSLYQNAQVVRTQVVVGDSLEPALNLIVNTTHTANSEPERYNLYLVPCEAGGDAGDLVPLSVGRGTAGEPYRFRLMSATPEANGNDWSTRAIIILMDYHQVSCNGTSVFVSDVWKNERTLIDLELPLSPEKGVHLAQAFTVSNPYQPITGTFTTWTSWRIAIVGE